MIRPALHRARAILRCTRGAAALEFAIVASVFIMLLIGVVEMGRAFFVQNQISHLADQAARRVLIDPTVSQSELQETLRENFSAGNPESLTLEVTLDSSGDTEYRIVSIRFPLTLFIPNFASNSLSLNVTRRVPTG